jgi:hypothetical protein
MRIQGCDEVGNMIEPDIGVIGHAVRGKIVDHPDIEDIGGQLIEAKANDSEHIARWEIKELLLVRPIAAYGIETSLDGVQGNEDSRDDY